MKLALTFLSLCFVGSIQGAPFSFYWNQGVRAVGPLHLEPNLSGDELFSSFIGVITKYLDNLYSALDDQFGTYINYYAGGAAMRNALLSSALSDTDDSAPADAFDDMIFNHTVYLMEFNSAMKDYLSNTKVLKPSPKSNLKSSLIQPRTKIHAFNDFLSYYDLVLTSDFAMLTSYIDEMLYLGKEAVVRNYDMYEATFQGGIPVICGQVERYIETSDTNQIKIGQHTSNGLFINYENLKYDIKNTVLNQAICSNK